VGGGKPYGNARRNGKNRMDGFL